MYKIESVIDNVIFLDIVTASGNNGISYIIALSLIKIKNKRLYKKSFYIKPQRKINTALLEDNVIIDKNLLYIGKNINEIRDEFITFLEDLPVICDSEKKYLMIKTIFHNLKNVFMNSFELAGILEPYHESFTKDYLLKNLTNKEFSTISIENLPLKNFYIVNSLLVRQYDRENREKDDLFNVIKNDYKNLLSWSWIKYIKMPLFFDFSKYDYVSFSDKIKKNIHKKNIKIDYKKCEMLLKNKEIFDNGTEFSYKYRPYQEEISRKIRENIQQNEKIFIEAPTGSGKTFAYVLVLVILSYINKLRNKRADASFIISTNTKELQNQLIKKDIPDIIDTLNLRNLVTFGSIKGKNNYICIDRINSCEKFDKSYESSLSEIYIRRFIKGGKFGDIDDINFSMYRKFNVSYYINDIVCDSDYCDTSLCKKECYFKNKCLNLSDENITVINHSLLACWPYKEKKKISHLIIDEAHNLLDKCYDFFSEEFSYLEFLKLLENIDKHNPTIIYNLTNLNISYGFRENIDKEKIIRLKNDAKINTELLLNEFKSMKISDGRYNYSFEFFLPPSDIKDNIKILADEIYDIKESIYALYKTIETYFKNIMNEDSDTDDKSAKVVSEYIVKLKKYFDLLDKFLEKNKNFAKIITVDSEYNDFKITNTPLNVGNMFNENILKDVKSTAFISATLKIDNSYKTIKNHLMQQEAKEYTVKPIFNLKDRTKIFALNDAGRYTSSFFIKRISNFIFNIAVKTNGHILVLFTNNYRKEQVLSNLEILSNNTDIEVYTNKKSINALKDPKRKVIILGTKLFFEGIDIPGDALNVVILDKLPNYSPEYPILKAVTTYKNKSYQSFNYPNLCIKMKQIYGRLIRSDLDYGYFIVLDPGINKLTMYNLQNDLNGPDIKNASMASIIKLIDADYKKYKRENLNSIINKIKCKDKEIYDNFNNESKINKLFWKVQKDDKNCYLFKNIDYVLKTTKKL
ncbi:helicase C-terminal domain-containing protein [Clostridium sp. BJN0001]|uniref:helicase C-terminal domain-containing protein n=1 Tax=Clostridium sp. BJN0001 TaxID=2930219 RepID=UPI001FD2CD84|nr:helicase C-terminal domain-containing protein [Clostridium sp. BJN0001]